MDLILAIFLDLIHVVKCFIIGDYFFSMKKEKRRAKWLILVVVTCLSSIILQYTSTYISIHISALIYLIFLIFVNVYSYKISKKDIVLIAIWQAIIMALMDDIMLVLADFILNVAEVTNRRLTELIATLCTLFFLYVMGKLIRSKSRYGISRIGIGYSILFLLLIIADVSIVTFLSTYIKELNAISLNIKLSAVYIVVVLGIFLQLLLVLLMIVSRDVHKEKERIANGYLEEQLAHYRYLEMREEKTKKFRHDIRHHILMLKSLYQEKDYEQMGKYLDELDHRVVSLGSPIRTHNGIVDAILTRYQEEAKQKGITFTVKGHMPVNCTMTAYDLCTIFSNLLSNACEAAENGPYHIVNVKLSSTKHKILIEIQNDFSGKLILEEDKLVTTKGDKDLHGFGMENAKECIRKNRGIIENTVEGQMFKVCINMERMEHRNEDSNCR